MSDWKPGLSKPADIISRWLHDYVYNEDSQALRVTMDSPFAMDIVYEHGESINTGAGGYAGMVVGGYTTGTEEFQGLTFSDDGRLKVDADVTIQSVELAVEVDALDGDTIGIYGFQGGPGGQLRQVNVTPNGAIRTVPGFAGIETNYYNETTVPAGQTSTILVQTIATGTEFQILLLSASGEADGVFKVKKNGNTLSCKRNSWANRNVEFEFLYGFQLNAGDIITVEVTNINEEDFLYNANFYGENHP